MKQNMWFKHKVSGTWYEVFDIAYDSSGYPLFLIYKDQQWVRLSAKNFEPSGDAYYEDYD